MERKGTNRYMAEHVYTKSIIDVHLEHLQPFRGTINDAEKAAQMDIQGDEYEVEKIVEHKFKRKQRILSAIQFRVRWKGWGSEFDSWKNYRDISDLQALDDYLINHPELHDIVPLDSSVNGPLKEDSVPPNRATKTPNPANVNGTIRNNSTKPRRTTVHRFTDEKPLKNTISQVTSRTNTKSRIGTD